MRPGAGRWGLAVVLASLVGTGASSAQAALPAAGVVFDDFVYGSATWAPELDSGRVPPPGSVYGVNPWTVPGGATRPGRAWYRYQWHELYPSPAGATLHATERDGGRLTFRYAPSRYHPDGCPDPARGAHALYPQQLMSGFAAERGTWAARVSFGPLAAGAAYSAQQAFWAVSLAAGRAGEAAVWDEVDVEWNNWFEGRAQTVPFAATAYRTGAEVNGLPLPLQPTPAPGAPADARPNACRLLRPDGTTAVLDRPACSASLAAAGPNDPGTLVVFRVADGGVSFDLRRNTPGGTLALSSAPAPGVPPPALPLAAVLSQHLYGPYPSTCADTVRLARPVVFEVDWFLYSPDPTLRVGDVERAVAYLRGTVRAPRFAGVPGLWVERPARFASGEMGLYGFAARTSPLAVRIVAPATLRHGERARLVALPPLRHGRYTFQWRVRTRRAEGWSGWTALPGTSYDASVTFPRDRRVVEAEVEVEAGELGPGNRVLGGPTSPVGPPVTARVSVRAGR